MSKSLADLRMEYFQSQVEDGDGSLADLEMQFLQEVDDGPVAG